MEQHEGKANRKIQWDHQAALRCIKDYEEVDT